MEKPYSFPVAISHLSELGDSREAQSERAIRWLIMQPGGEINVVTPRKTVSDAAIARFVKHSDVRHVSWKGLSTHALRGRVLLAWPNQKILDDFWSVTLDALSVIEWEPIPEWNAVAEPLILEPGRVSASRQNTETDDQGSDLPHDVTVVLGHLAKWAQGYSSGLKWNEIDKLKADLMNRPGRWAGVDPAKVRLECRRFGMRPSDVSTITDLVTRATQGRRLRPSDSYRDFHFLD